MLFIILLTESILDVRGTEGLLEVLLVGEDQEGDVLVVLVLHRPPQLHLGLVQLVGLGAVHHKDDAVSAPEPIRDKCSGHVTCIIQSEASILLPGVAPPQRSDLLLAADVPDEEGEAAGLAHGALDPLAVEAHGGHGVHVLVKLEPIQCSRFASAVKSNHHNVEIFF